MSCRQLCWIFCCPPCPSNITEKLAFMPPSPSSYILAECPETNTLSLTITDTSFNWPIEPNLITALCEVSQHKTLRGNNIVCVFIPYKSYERSGYSPRPQPKEEEKPSPQSDVATSLNDTITSNVSPVCPPCKTLFHSHGNAVDIGGMLLTLFQLGQLLGVNIATYDYSGYGMSTGRPTEANIYADADCAFEYFMERYRLTPSDVIIYGQSIGSVPSMHLASHAQQVSGVVLHSPFSSGLRLCCGLKRVKRSHSCDPFRNIDKAPNILAPTLVIHGTDDTVVPVEHAYQIHASLPNAIKPPLIIEGAMHDNCEHYPEYLHGLYDFIHREATGYVSTVTLTDVC